MILNLSNAIQGIASAWPSNAVSLVKLDIHCRVHSDPKHGSAMVSTVRGWQERGRAAVLFSAQMRTYCDKEPCKLGWAFTQSLEDSHASDLLSGDVLCRAHILSNTGSAAGPRSDRRCNRS